MPEEMDDNGQKQTEPPPPKGSLAGTPHSGDRPDSLWVYFATLVLLYHRSCRMIAESGTPARVRPTRLTWL